MEKDPRQEQVRKKNKTKTKKNGLSRCECVNKYSAALKCIGIGRSISTSIPNRASSYRNRPSADYEWNSIFLCVFAHNFLFNCVLNAPCNFIRVLYWYLRIFLLHLWSIFLSFPQLSTIYQSIVELSPI